MMAPLPRPCPAPSLAPCTPSSRCLLDASVLLILRPEKRLHALQSRAAAPMPPTLIYRWRPLRHTIGCEQKPVASAPHLPPRANPHPGSPAPHLHTRSAGGSAAGCAHARRSAGSRHSQCLPFAAAAPLVGSGDAAPLHSGLALPYLSGVELACACTGGAQHHRLPTSMRMQVKLTTR